MPYFKNVATHEIVFRQYEFNSEALNGEIELVDDSSDCLIISHFPNRKFGYDIQAIENIDPEKGLEKIKQLGTKQEDAPEKPFYSLILSEDLRSYEQAHSEYTFKTKKEDVPEVSKRDNKKISAHKKQPTPTKSAIYSPKLVRDVNNEKRIKFLR